MRIVPQRQGAAEGRPPGDAAPGPRPAGGAGPDVGGTAGREPGGPDGVREEPEPAAGPEGSGPPPPRRIGVLAVLAAGVYLLDLISKILVVRYVEDGPPIPIIGELLQLRVIRNSGAAFSIGTGMTVVFTVIAVAVTVVIVRTARRLRSLPWAVTLGLLLGGVLGNLTDRIFRAPAPFQGHVVDFIAVPNFPVFNLADSAIVCGGALAVFFAWRGHQIDGTRETGKEEGR